MIWGIALFVAQLLLVLGSVAFAYITGGLPERRAAIWWGANWFAGTLIVVFRLNSPTLQLVIDGVCATGFLPLAVLDVSWLAGAVTLLSAATFTLEATYLLDDRKIDNFYIFVNNSLTLAIALVFLASGFLHRNKRRKRGDGVAGGGLPLLASRLFSFTPPQGPELR
jgi:hypothetical protein